MVPVATRLVLQLHAVLIIIYVPITIRIKKKSEMQLCILTKLNVK